MNIPANLRYTSSHEWVRTEADGTVSIGITDHAQAALGDLVYLELPAVGRKLAAAEACAVVESVKAASDVYAPVAGEVVAVNTRGQRSARAGQQGSVRGVVLPHEARRRRRHREPARRARVRGDDRRRVTPRRWSRPRGVTPRARLRHATP